jgi:transposase-like protein
MRLFAVICWTLGLSYRGVSMILSGLKIVLCPMTVWRDAQEQGEKLRRRNEWKPVRVLGLDGAYVLWLVGLRGPVLWIAAAVGLVIACRFLIDWNRQYRELWLDREKKP